jgi:hypothetical protein
MKLHDFGLWFEQYGKWSTTIPDIEENFSIYYDGNLLGRHWKGVLTLINNISSPYKIEIKAKFIEIPNSDDYLYSNYRQYVVDRRLTMEDFEVIPNPDYIGV